MDVYVWVCVAICCCVVCVCVDSVCWCVCVCVCCVCWSVCVCDVCLCVCVCAACAGGCVCVLPVLVLLQVDLLCRAVASKHDHGDLGVAPCVLNVARHHGHFIDDLDTEQSTCFVQGTHM